MASLQHTRTSSVGSINQSPLNTGSLQHARTPSIGSVTHSPVNRGSPQHARNPSTGSIPQSPLNTNSPQHARTPSAGSIAQGMRSLDLTPSMKRPGFGTNGTTVDALTNYFETDLSGVPDLLEYTVQISSKDRRNNQIVGRVRHRIIFLLLQHNPAFKFAASDYGHVIISTKPLTSGQATSCSYTVDYFEIEESGPRSGGNQLLFQVAISFCYRYNMQDFRNYQNNQSGQIPSLSKYIAGLNIILARTVCQNVNMVAKARREKLFDIRQNNGRGNLGMGLSVYKGYFRSARMTSSGLLVNLNVASSAMYWEGPLDRFMEAIAGNKNSDELHHHLRHLNSQVHFLRIETRYSGHPVRKTIFRIARSANPNRAPTAANVFFTKGGRQVSVEEHFRTTYPQVRRTNPHALVVDVGSRERPVYIPADLCHIFAGQTYRDQLPFASQSKEMIRFACRTPLDNRNLILNEGLEQIGVGVPGGPQDRFGFRIRPQMLLIKARMLPKPLFAYATPPDTKIGEGSWNMIKKRFKRPAPEVAFKTSWLELLQPSMKPTPNRTQFLKLMQQAMGTYTGHKSPKLETFQDFEHSRTLPTNFGRSMMGPTWQNLLNRGVRLVFVILPNRDPEIYRAIKASAIAMGNGIHTVCTVRKEDSGEVKVLPGELANLMLKVNPKLGGTNLVWNVPDPLKPLVGTRTMFIGADVVHPPKTAMVGAPSVAAVVASIDDGYGLCPGCFRLQTPDQDKKAVEFIKDFGDMCNERLRLYWEKNKNVLPELIVVYRDGVADNMFAEVVNEEVAQLQRTCKQAYSKQQQKLPKLIFMVAQKRGHTRFYQPPGFKSSAFDSKGNPQPGFVVDTQITSAQAFDWFLVSHKCLQGTSRPAHYTILHDDSGATADQLQFLTHATSFLLPRATKSISIAAPARAADLMAGFAAIFLYDVYHVNVEPGDERPRYEARSHWPGLIAPNLKDTMFYI